MASNISLPVVFCLYIFILLIELSHACIQPPSLQATKIELHIKDQDKIAYKAILNDHHINRNFYISDLKICNQFMV